MCLNKKGTRFRLPGLCCLVMKMDLPWRERQSRDSGDGDDHDDCDRECDCDYEDSGHDDDNSAVLK